MNVGEGYRAAVLREVRVDGAEVRQAQLGGATEGEFYFCLCTGTAFSIQLARFHFEWNHRPMKP